MTATATDPGLVSLVYARRLSPPAHIELRPRHLPAPCVDALNGFRDALEAERTAQQAASKARGSKPEQEAAEHARAEVDQALQNLLDVTAGSSSAIVDSATAAYGDELAAALAAIGEAQRHLTAAQHARALQLKVRPGRPVTNLGLDSRTLRDDPAWQRLSGVRQVLRDAVDAVQEVSQ